MQHFPLHESSIISNLFCSLICIPQSVLSGSIVSMCVLIFPCNGIFFHQSSYIKYVLNLQATHDPTYLSRISFSFHATPFHKIHGFLFPVSLLCVTITFYCFEILSEYCSVPCIYSCYSREYSPRSFPSAITDTSWGINIPSTCDSFEHANDFPHIPSNIQPQAITPKDVFLSLGYPLLFIVDFCWRNILLSVSQYP